MFTRPQLLRYVAGGLPFALFVFVFWLVHVFSNRELPFVINELKGRYSLINHVPTAIQIECNHASKYLPKMTNRFSGSYYICGFQVDLSCAEIFAFYEQEFQTVGWIKKSETNPKAWGIQTRNLEIEYDTTKLAVLVTCEPDRHSYTLGLYTKS